MAFGLRVLALGTVLVLASGQSSAQNPTLRTAMRNKLAHAQQLLEAVVTSDYAAVGRSADALGRISETEVASWQAGARPEYVKQAMQFLRSVQALRVAAETGNGEAALAAYTALVSSCTHCHAQVRNFRGISFEGPFFR